MPVEKYVGLILGAVGILVGIALVRKERARPKASVLLELVPGDASEKGIKAFVTNTGRKPFEIVRASYRESGLNDPRLATEFFTAEREEALAVEPGQSATVSFTYDPKRVHPLWVMVEIQDGTVFTTSHRWLW